MSGRLRSRKDRAEESKKRFFFWMAFGHLDCSLKIELCDKIDGKQEPSIALLRDVSLGARAASFKIANKVSRTDYRTSASGSVGVRSS